MSHNSLAAHRLQILHSKWLELRDQYPMVCHCSARQDSSVRLTYLAEDGDLPIGEIAAVVYDREFFDQGAKHLTNVVFSGWRQEFAFELQLHRSFWTSASLRSLTMQDRVFSMNCHDDDATRIAFPNLDGQWVGCCVFEREWDNDGRIMDWFEKVGQLSSESLSLRSNFVAASRNHSRLLESWLSHVYPLLNVNVVSQPVSAACNALGGLTLSTEDSKRVIPVEKGSVPRFVRARVDSSLMWLPSDVCTASAIAIERILSGEPDAAIADTGKRSGKASEPDSDGYVRDPADESAYVPKSEILTKHTPTRLPIGDKSLTATLSDFTRNGVRWTRPKSAKSGQPHPQRLSVHLADWSEYVSNQMKQDATEEYNLDEDLPSQAEIRKRAIEVRRSKKGK